MHLRVARHTERLDEVVAFYRDGVGLPEIGRFRDHDGYDGVFLAIPGVDAHLELTSGGPDGAPAPHPESLLVLYVGDADTMRDIAARLPAGPVPSANPYWARHALTFEDPDGFRVVIVPGLYFIFGHLARVENFLKYGQGAPTLVEESPTPPEPTMLPTESTPRGGSEHD